MKQKKITKENYEKACVGYNNAYQQANRLSKKRDVEIIPLQTKINDVVSKYESYIIDQHNIMKENAAIIEAYCDENKSVLFAASKSIKVLFGSIGFRQSKGKVVIPFENDKTKFESFMSYMQKFLPGYVRTKVELNKQAIARDYNTDKALQNKLKKQNVTVESEESFFIDVNQ